MRGMVLHLGYPKTGTTSLQTVVFPRLAGPSLGYLGISSDGAIRTDNRYLRWRRVMTGLRPGWHRPRVDLASLVSSNHLRGSADEKLLISEETLLTEPLHHALVGGRSSSRSFTSTLRRLRRLIPAGISLVVLLTIRRQEDLVPAFVAQEAHRVSRARYRSIDHAIARMDESNSELKRLLSFDAVLQDIQVELAPEHIALAPIELLEADPDRFASILAASVGLGSTFPSVPRTNSRRVERDAWATSYGFWSSLIHRAYAAAPIPLPPEQMKRFSNFSATPRPTGDAPVIHRTESQRAHLREIFAESNHATMSRYGVDLATLGYCTGGTVPHRI